MLSAQIKPTFYKLNVHAAMTPADIWNHFEPVFAQAKVLQEAFESRVKEAPTLRLPFVTVGSCFTEHQLHVIYIVVMCSKNCYSS